MAQPPDIRLREDGIVEIRFAANPDVDTDSLRALFAARAVIAPGRHPILLYVSEGWPAVAEGAAYSIDEEVVRDTSAVAMVGGWAMMEWLLGLHVMVHKVPYPMKHFTNTEDAVEWLKTYV